jgi:hypothetical protein
MFNGKADARPLIITPIRVMLICNTLNGKPTLRWHMQARLCSFPFRFQNGWFDPSDCTKGYKDFLFVGLSDSKQVVNWVKVK